jgi:hypothetical protein
MKKVLIASSNPWSFAVAVEREVARMHGDAQVDMVNLYHLASRHSPHWRPFDRFAEAINRKIERFVRPVLSGRDITRKVEARLNRVPIPALPSRPEDLRGYCVGEARIGLAVLSSVTSVTTVQDPLSIDEYGSAFPKAWRSAHLSERMARAIEPLDYDTVYIFNGRHCYSRPFCDVLQRSSTVYRYEQGGSGNRYISSPVGVHRPSEVVGFIMSHDFDPAEGEEFYQARLRKAPGSTVDFFTFGQVAGSLPAGVEPGRAVTFYTSGADEMHAVSDAPGFGKFADQNEIAVTLASVVAQRGERLVVRFHPHLRYKHSSWKREWDFDRLREMGAILLPPDDSTDSYALLRASRCILTCGSTLGFEATYLGLPAADVGDWLGGELGAVARVLSPAEAAAFVTDPRVPAGAYDLAIRYGSYARRGGNPLSEYTAGSHPYFDRVDGRIVDPFRAAYHRLREPFLSGSNVVLPPGGKIMVEPSVTKALAKQMREA